MIEHAYIHIPFCLRKCKYCSFVSGENIKYKNDYLSSLIFEINRKYKKEKLETLYIGGGTPSLLEMEDIYKILECFNFSDNAEITIEANPETVNYEKFKNYKSLGINRVSLGIQTFEDNILQYLNREHNASQAIKSVDIIKNAGFNNINIDLIYGLPFQSLIHLKKDLIKAEKLSIQHISTYGLKIEDNSFFSKNPPQKLPDDEKQAQMYHFICDFLIKYNHYEISNFAKIGFSSKHNLAYWQNKEYYGFGVNSSGYENNIRYKNVVDFREYIKNPLKKEEEIKLTKDETMENEIFLNLRLKSGINVKEINKKFNINFMDKYRKILNNFLNLGLISSENGIIKLTREGILLSNEVMSEFIEV